MFYWYLHSEKSGKPDAMVAILIHIIMRFHLIMETSGTTGTHLATVLVPIAHSLLKMFYISSFNCDLKPDPQSMWYILKLYVSRLQEFLTAKFMDRN